MVHLEFGQDRLAESYPLKAFELAGESGQRCFRPIFNDPPRARLGSFCKIILFLPHEVAW